MRWRFSLAIALALIACNSAAGLGDLEFTETTDANDGGAGSQNNTSGNGGAAGDGGDAPFLCMPEDCPGESTDCVEIVCVNNECATLNTDTLTPCDDGGGSFCDGLGDCVECINDAQTPCPSGGVCQNFRCYAAGCGDLVRNNGESDIDCGGPNCGPCDNGAMCNATSDCLSGLCPSGFCDACSSHADCGNPNDVYCEPDTGFCASKKGLLEGCTEGYECTTGCCMFGYNWCHLPSYC